MINVDYEFEYFAQVKDYHQYGIILADEYEFDLDGNNVSQIVIQKHHSTGEVTMSVGNWEEYCVHEELAELHGYSPVEVLNDILHLSVWLDPVSDGMDATTHYVAWLEHFYAVDCGEDYNLVDYLWLYSELEADVQAKTTYVEGHYYTKTGVAYQPEFDEPAPHIIETA